MHSHSDFSGALVGPGSQPLDFDGSKLEYMVMPSGMMTYSAAHVPEAEDARQHAAGLAAAQLMLDLLGRAVAQGEGGRIDLSGLSTADLEFVDQLLGEGEVSVVAGSAAQAQESVLAGVWRVRRYDDSGARAGDYVEVGAFPQELLSATFSHAANTPRVPEEVGTNVFNAPALLAEIADNAPKATDSAKPHVINLSLLPHTEDDLAFLDRALGRGQLVILSRGYGNCRIQATGTHNTWWVRYYNSQDTLILNSIELSPVPEVALAAAEDLADSAERLAEILEAYA
ncbi:MAG: hydrogenase expression/formation C-terminal domain-containing protein [Pseudomonadota bacterium]